MRLPHSWHYPTFSSVVAFVMVMTTRLGERKQAAVQTAVGVQGSEVVVVVVVVVRGENDSFGGLCQHQQFALFLHCRARNSLLCRRRRSLHLLTKRMTTEVEEVEEED
jgi:hypothetical protein